MEPNEKTETKRWTLPVDEDGVLVLPDELWAELGWKEGDSLEWVDQEDGSFLLVKVEESDE
jgi:bifunctional DNA-binding transcriptional regulator/antitoxin component of YhaV-PrlF toxin-antitoxin module